MFWFISSGYIILMEIKYLNKEIAIWINDFLITRSNSLDFDFPEENEQSWSCSRINHLEQIMLNDVAPWQEIFRLDISRMDVDRWKC